MVKPAVKEEVNTEEKILEAAKDEFMKFGLYGARMQAIADSAGINKAMLHYYFRSKEKLFDKVFDGALERYFNQMDVWDDTSLSFKRKLMQYIDNLIDFLTEYPQISLFIIKEMSVSPDMFREKIDALQKSRKKRLYLLLEEEMAAGNIRKTDPEMFIINLHSLCFYPFIATPLYKRIFMKNTRQWKETVSDKLKQSVKAFVEQTLAL
jgi:AcrR family transcriptional regulator